MICKLQIEILTSIILPFSLVNEEKVSIANDENLHYGQTGADDTSEFFNNFHNLGEVLIRFIASVDLIQSN